MMFGCRFIQPVLFACEAAGLWALHLKQQGATLGGTNVCSFENYVSNEMSLLSTGTGGNSGLGCTDVITEGVDFVTFVRRPESQRRPASQRRSKSHRRPMTKNGDKNRSLLSVSSSFDTEENGTDGGNFNTVHYWGDGHGQGLLGDKCWSQCSAPGYCQWCGDGNACCKKGSDHDPEDPCNSVTEWHRDGDHHECVEAPAWTDSNVNNNEEQLVVWVSGYPRSGSSVLLSMVSATVDDNRAAGRTFSLFEPCHGGDSYEKWMESKGCRQLLYGVAHCDFKGIQQLWGWRDPHSSNNHSKDFDQAAARSLCQEADIIAFKTVDWGHDLNHWKWLLDTRENMKVLDVVRDPRAIYGSWKKLEPFKSLVEAGDFYSLRDICDHFAMNIGFEDSRVHRVVFEDLMKSPKGITQGVYDFLGQEFGAQQELWLRKAFNAAECPPPPPGMEGFTDCHTWTGLDPRGDEKWRTLLSEEELSYFATSESCQRVAIEYDYPLM